MARPSAIACANDELFGPEVQACRGNFDFTLLFEQIFFMIVPACIFVSLGLISILNSWRRPQVIKACLLGQLKLLCTCLYACIKFSIVILGSQEIYLAFSMQRTAVAAAVADLAAALLLIPLSWLNHSRSPRSSFIIELYLFASCILDIASVRTLWLLTPERVRTVYASGITTALAIKSLLLLLESFPKEKWLIWNRKNVSPEEMSGLYSVSLFAWLYRLFMAGYKSILTLENLYQLDQAMDADSILSRFQLKLEKHALRRQKGGIAVLLIRTLYLQLLLPIIPRIVLLGASFSQPFLIDSLVKFLQQETRDKRHGYGLIVATLLVYGVIATSTSCYWYLQERFTIRVRGCLVSIIYDKSTKLKSSATSDATVVTLMSTDVERIMVGILDIHEFWANLVQVTVACWLLQRELGTAFIAPLVVVFIASVLAAVVAKLITPRQRAWMEAIQTRVAVTADTLAHIKSIKLTGMIKPVQDYLQSLRVKEIKFGSRWRILLACTAAISHGPMLLSPVLTFAFTTSSLGTSTVFVSIAYLTLLASPLMILFQRFPQLVSALVCLGRIQMFLEKEERLDYRHTETHVILEDLTGILGISEEAKSGAIELQAPPRTPWEPCIKVSNGSFGWSRHADVLTDVNFHIPTCQLTMVTGIVGTGKSTLCRALLGEIPFAKGTISMSRHLRIGYCDQKPFLYNSSIRNNIIGFDEFIQERYDTVVYATKIDEDVKSLALGDQTVVGSGGIALSGGQRQRLSIARALYQRGMNILIFDDVLSGLDAITEEHVFEHVFGRQGLLQQHQITTILCTHNSRRLLAANHIIWLQGNSTLTEESQISEHQEDLVLCSPANRKIDEPSACDVESAQSSQPIIIASSGEFTSLQQSSARRLGDVAVYKYYFESIGLMPMAILLVAGLCYGFLANFPRVWLTFWAQDADRGSGAKHSYAYYIGIYSLLQISCLVSGIISLLVVLVAFIRQSGAVLHQRLLDTISTATLTLYTLTDIGVLTNYFSQDMNLIDSELPLALLNILLDLASVIGMAALLASASPWLILAYPGLILILWYLQHFYLRTSRQVRLLDLEAKSPLYSHFLDTLKGITTIRAFGWVGPSMTRHKQLLEQSQRATYMRSMIQRWLFLALGLIVMIVATALVALITQIGAGAEISGASLVTLMTFSQSLTDIVQFYAALETSIGSVARLKSFIATTDSEVKPGRDVSPDNNWPSTGRLVLQNAWASYKNIPVSAEDYSLKSVNLSISNGEKVAICGRTGSGKSSLVLLLLGFLDLIPQRGIHSSISLDDQSLMSINCETLRERVITIPQDPVFLPSGSTVMQNLDPFGLATREQCEAVLRDLGLLDVLSNIKCNIDSEMNSNALSQGQRQLFVLARAVLKRRTLKSLVLILDEFTSSVDSTIENQMMDIIETEFQQCTIIMISHRLDSVLKLFDRVLVMDKGKIVETGDPRLLSLKSESHFASLLRAEKQKKTFSA